MWLSPSDVAGADGRPATVSPATVSGALLTRDGPGVQQDLFTLIGVRQLGLLRFVVVQTLTLDSPGDAAVTSAGKQVADLISRVLPQDVHDSTAAWRTSMLRVNLLVPESGRHQSSQDLLQPGWEVNAIMAPEDRPDLDRGSIYVRSNVNLNAHAAAGVAAAGGLWPGVEEGALDGWENDSSSAVSDLVVERNFRLDAQRTGISAHDVEAALVSRSALGRMVEADEVGRALIAMLHMPGLTAADIDLSAGMVAR